MQTNMGFLTNIILVVLGAWPLRRASQACTLGNRLQFGDLGGSREENESDLPFSEYVQDRQPPGLVHPPFLVLVSNRL